MATIRDVAAAAGVSTKTVSRVFNGDPHVRPETRARVETTIRELSYVPNVMATSFRSGRSGVIGIAIPDIVDPFFASIVRAVEAVTLAQGMSIMVANLGDDPEREHEILEWMLSRQLSGIIVAPTSDDQGSLAVWADRIPVVFIDRAPRGLAADTFVQDDYRGAFDATMHLIGHGHRRVAFLGGRLALPTIAARFEGYRSALDESAIGFDDELTALDASARESAAAALDRFAGLALPPTAVFSSNAVSTVAMIPSLGEHPLGLVAFGDFPLADMVSPSISVIEQDPIELGRLAATRILDRIESPGGAFDPRTVLDVRFIERMSCQQFGSASISG